MIKKVEISHKTIIFGIMFLVFLWFLYIIKDLILELFVALLLTAILSPLVEKLYKHKIPKGVSVAFSYVLIFIVLGGSIALIVPALVEQTSNLVNTLPANLESLGIQRYANGEVVRQLISQLGSIPGQLVKAGFGIFSNILNVLTVFIFAFYFLLIRDRLEKNLENFFGKQKGAQFLSFVKELEFRLGGWARGQFVLMFAIGLTTYVGLLILGIPYALPLAVLAGVLEIIPYLGPIIAAVPAVILGFSVSGFLGLATIGLAFLIQQLENYLIVPKVMEKSVGVSPVVTLFALSVGFRLAGIVGIIISVPIVIIIQLLLHYRFSQKS